MFVLLWRMSNTVGIMKCAMMDPGGPLFFGLWPVTAQGSHILLEAGEWKSTGRLLAPLLELRNRSFRLLAHRKRGLL
jgi:hypothetical protein